MSAGACRPIIPRSDASTRRMLDPTASDTPEMLTPDIMVKLVGEWERERLRFWNENGADEEPRAQYTFLGFAVRRGPDERGDRLRRFDGLYQSSDALGRCGEVLRPSALPRELSDSDFVKPNIERWLVRDLRLTADATKRSCARRSGTHRRTTWTIADSLSTRAGVRRASRIGCGA